MAISDEDKAEVLEIVLKHAKTGDAGVFGDGKIFISPVEAVFTVSSGAQGI